MSAVDKIQLEDLNDEQQQVVELIGLENFKRLITVFGGVNLYIPKVDKLERMDRNDNIRAEFNGYNFRELAQKYGLTEVSIRNIVSDKLREIRAQPMDDQLSIL